MVLHVDLREIISREKEMMSDPVNDEPEPPQPCAARVTDEPRPPRPPRKRKEEPSRIKVVEAVSEPVNEPMDPMFFVALNVTKKKMVQHERHHRMSSLKIV